MVRYFACALVALSLATGLSAEAPEQSLRPMARPDTGTTEAPAIVLASASSSSLPVRRFIPTFVPGVAVSLVPLRRPGDMADIVRRAEPAMGGSFSTRRTRPRAGSVCGDSAIRGETIPRIRGRINGCGVNDPVRVTEVDGVRLTQGITVECDTVRALKRWINEGVRPAVGRRGGGVASLRVVAHYACRTRNNRPGARISEHGRGRAVDIAAVNLQDGSSLTVLQGWNDPSQRDVLRQMHRSACGPFGTVLGPGSDGYHRDHFHLDVADYRSGPYCR